MRAVVTGPTAGRSSAQGVRHDVRQGGGPVSRAVRFASFGGPEVLDVTHVLEPHAGVQDVRVRVTFAGLNPVDRKIIGVPEFAERFGVALPAGFGHDFAGVVDEVGEEVTDFAVGDRVYGGSFGAAAADHVVLSAADGSLRHTPDTVEDEVAATLAISGRTAAAALDTIDVRSGDTVLIGGATGGVGVFAVQLARIAGARVIGTASEGSHPFLAELGAEPVAYGPGLADRVRALVPEGLAAATSLVGFEAVDVALELGVAPERISTIDDGPTPYRGSRPTGGFFAAPDALDRVARAVAAGQVTVPIAATFPLEKIRDAVTLQSGGHVRGKVVLAL